MCVTAAWRATSTLDLTEHYYLLQKLSISMHAKASQDRRLASY